MKRIAILAAAAAVVFASTRDAQAQVVTWNYTFTSVDAVSARSYTLYVTGLLEGGTSAVEASIPFSSTGNPTDALASCQRMALLAMAKVGQYRLQLAYASGYPACRLVRVTP